MLDILSQSLSNQMLYYKFLASVLELRFFLPIMIVIYWFHYNMHCSNRLCLIVLEDFYKNYIVLFFHFEHTCFYCQSSTTAYVYMVSRRISRSIKMLNSVFIYFQMRSSTRLSTRMRTLRKLSGQKMWPMRGRHFINQINRR